MEGSHLHLHHLLQREPGTKICQHIRGGSIFLESGIWFSEILALLNSKNVLNTFATLIKICVSVCLGQKRIKVKV